MDRLLLRLPPLGAGDAICLLPLSERSAAALVTALLQNNSAVRADRFASILRRDPALAIWCAIHPRRRTTPRDFCELGAWLATSASILQWPEGVPTSSQRSDSELDSRHTERVAKALALAEAAERLVTTTEAADRTRLLAYLSLSYEWLIACSAPRDPDVVEKLAPRWLRRLVADVREYGSSSDPAIDAVRRASRAVPRLSQEASTQDGASWSQEVPWAAEALPRLTARLARLEELESDFQVVLRREKLASLQKLAYGASHEINNPLANIATRAQTLLQDEPDPERQRALATINDQAFRAFEMIANMMLFAKPPEFNLAPTDLCELIDRAAKEMQPEAQQQGTTLRARVAADSPLIQADATQLAVLLRALLRNALEAVACGGEIELTARRGDEDHVILAVRDTGPGLSEEARRHLYDPFYSSREAGRGLGFGLSWCWTIVDLHRGRIDFESEPGKGTTFLITLPVGRQ
jgi:signal transduction histidine kinase